MSRLTELVFKCIHYNLITKHFNLNKEIQRGICS